MSVGSEFHSLGPLTLNAWAADVLYFAYGIINSSPSFDLKLSCIPNLLLCTNRFFKYAGESESLKHLNTINSILKLMWALIGSQCNLCNAAVELDYRSSFQTILPQSFEHTSISVWYCHTHQRVDYFHNPNEIVQELHTNTLKLFWSNRCCMSLIFF